jgi:hypothetical protein
MKMFAFALAAALSAIVGTTAADAAPIKAYKTEAGAQKHCPGDEIVWANSASTVGAFHLRGSKYFEATKSGAFVCRAEAEAGGWHAAANGQ